MSGARSLTQDTISLTGSPSHSAFQGDTHTLTAPDLRIRSISLLITVSLLGACSSQPQPQTIPSTRSDIPPEAANNTLPESTDVPSSSPQLIEAIENYRAGVELIAANDDQEGQRRLGLARTALLDAANSCAHSENCSSIALATTTELLLGESEVALLAQAARIRHLEAHEESEGGTDEDRYDEVAAPVGEPIGRPEVGEAYETEARELGDWLTLNARVEAELDDWLTWRRPMLIESWINYQYLKPIMAPVYAEAELPEALLFGMLATESGAKVHASSRAGARGPLQFMSYTGRRFGLTTVDGFDLRLDPEASVRANVAYLQEQLARLGGDLELTLAAYNGGENRLRGLHRRYPSANLWDQRIYYSLPRETRDYVPRILAAARLFTDPSPYNLQFPEVSTETTRIVLERDSSVGELAICLGSAGDRPLGWFRTVRNLNPRFDARDRIKSGSEVVLPAELLDTYKASCQQQNLLETAHALFQANYPPEPPTIRYRVTQGDTLSRIASRHRCASIGQISSLNSIRPPRYTIRVGQTLKIPACH